MIRPTSCCARRFSSTYTTLCRFDRQLRLFKSRAIADSLGTFSGDRQRSTSSAVTLTAPASSSCILPRGLQAGKERHSSQLGAIVQPCRLLSTNDGGGEKDTAEGRGVAAPSTLHSRPKTTGAIEQQRAVGEEEDKAEDAVEKAS